MAIKRLFLIVNPKGGRRLGVQICEQVCPLFKAAGIALEIVETRNSGHAQEIVAKLDLIAFDALGVIGGDGTIHEVINGMLARSDGQVLPLGCIPGGTGNALMHDLGCLDPLDAARRIISSVPKPVDCLQVTMGDEIVYVLTLVGWGMLVDVNRIAERLRLLGTSRYVWASLWFVLMPRRRRARLIMADETIEDSFLFIMGCNTRYTGKGMCVAPNAKVDDGLLDLVMVRDASRWQLLRIFPKIFSGSHVDDPMVSFHQLDAFSIYPVEMKGVLNLDGENKGGTPVEVKVLPGAFSVLV